MQQDLHINGKQLESLGSSYQLTMVRKPSDIQYATVIAILFVSYCPAQIPSNMVNSVYPMFQWKDLTLSRLQILNKVSRYESVMLL